MLDAIKNLFNNKRASDNDNDDGTVSAASLEDTKRALDAVASKHGFRCVPVSWEDAQRGTVGGALSCWGGNISDVRLWAKDGTLLYTLRTENWNERLGYVASKDVAVVVGNHVPGGEPFAPVTLQRYLKDFKKYGSYAGVESEQLWDEAADQLLSVRFQAVFLPIKDEETSEFCTEVYNYNAHSDDNPRNCILLCTAQGTNVQQDGSGAKKIFIHNVDRSNTVHRYWLEAERSKHKVGGAQQETDEEAAAAAARGKATAIHIGTKEMGTRFNVQMLIQLPLQQKSSNAYRGGAPGCGGGGGGCIPMPMPVQSASCVPCAPPSVSMAMCCEEMAVGAANDCDFEEHILCAEQQCDEMGAEDEDSYADCKEAAAVCGDVMADDDCADKLMCEEEVKCCDEEEEAPQLSKKKKMAAPSLLGSAKNRRECAPEKPKKAPKIGTANAARVSRGSEHDTWKGVANKTPTRDPSQHGTITVTLYYTVAGGVPSPADVEACVADLDALYKACPTDKRLVDCGEITAELTVKNMADIAKKVVEQPYTPDPQVPVKSTFPVDDE